MANPELAKMLAAVKDRPTLFVLRMLLELIETQKTAIDDLTTSQRKQSETIDMLQRRSSGLAPGGGSPLSVG